MTRLIIAHGSRGRLLTSCMLALLASTATSVAAEEKLPQIYAMSPTGVNLQNGRFVYSATDLAIGPLKLVRSIHLGSSFAPNGSSSTFNTFGEWSHNFGFGVVVTAPAAGTIASVIIEGKSVQFRSGPSLWEPWSYDAPGSELTVINGNFQFVSKGGDVYNFRTHPQLTNGVISNGTQVIEFVDYADGSRLDFTYDASARVKTVSSNRGYAVVLDYGPAGQIVSACGYNSAVQYIDGSSTCQGAALSASYSYRTTSAGYTQLSSTRDASGQSSTIIDDDNGNLACVTVPGTQSCQFTNVYGPQPGEDPTVTLSSQVRKQTMATGEVWQFHYSNTNSYIDFPPQQPGDIRYSDATMIDPKGSETYAIFANGIPESVSEPGGLTKYRFNGLVPREFTYPEGNIVDLLRDSRQNVLSKTLKAKPGSGLADLVWRASYPADRYEPSNTARIVGCNAASQKLCDKPSSTIDPNGNQTDYTYDPAHGGVLTETGPAVNGVRSQTRYAYVQRSAWVKNSGSGYSPAAPVWLLAQKSICKTGNAAGNGCATGGDEVRTTYDYGPDSGPNNLMLRGVIEDASGLSRRTCYAYDAQGNKISETKPSAGLTVCP